MPLPGYGFFQYLIKYSHISNLDSSQVIIPLSKMIHTCIDSEKNGHLTKVHRLRYGEGAMGIGEVLSVQ